MKITVCDVCEEKVEGTVPEWISATIPGVMLGDFEGTEMHIDVCSLACLGAIGINNEVAAPGGFPTEEEDVLHSLPETLRETLPERTTGEDQMTDGVPGQISISIPNGALRPQAARYMTEDESSAVTGVTRKW